MLMKVQHYTDGCQELLGEHQKFENEQVTLQ